MYQSDSEKGNLSNWSPAKFLFGDEFGGGRDWSGTLQNVAIYNRALSAQEAQQHAMAWQRLSGAAKP